MTKKAPTWITSPSENAPCTIIAEIAQAHDGSLGTAYKMIDAAAKAGVDAVKFQTHIAEAESSLDEPWRKKFIPQQDETRFDYWKRMEFKPEQWAVLKARADEKGLAFISSPFSNKAVELLQNLGVAAWKIASGEVNNHMMIDKMCQGGEPIILSSGMSDLDEIGDSVDFIKSKNVPLCVLQCTTSYPTKAHQVGVNMLPVFAEKFGVASGLSDHSAKIFPGLIAAWQGAKVIEVHLTLTKRAFGPDVGSSLTVKQMKKLVKGVRYVEKMKTNPHDKTRISDDIVPLREIFMKSLVVNRAMKAGETIMAEDLDARKPAYGISVRRYDEIIGRTLARNVEAITPLQEDDLV